MTNFAGNLGVVTSMRTKAGNDLGARLVKAVPVPAGEVAKAITATAGLLRPKQ